MAYEADMSFPAHAERPPADAAVLPLDGLVRVDYVRRVDRLRTAYDHAPSLPAESELTGPADTYVADLRQAAVSSGDSLQDRFLHASLHRRRGIHGQEQAYLQDITQAHLATRPVEAHDPGHKEPVAALRGAIMLTALRDLATMPRLVAYEQYDRTRAACLQTYLGSHSEAFLAGEYVLTAAALHEVEAGLLGVGYEMPIPDMLRLRQEQLLEVAAVVGAEAAALARLTLAVDPSVAAPEHPVWQHGYSPLLIASAGDIHSIVTQYPIARQRELLAKLWQQPFAIDEAIAATEPPQAVGQPEAVRRPRGDLGIFERDYAYLLAAPHVRQEVRHMRPGDSIALTEGGLPIRRADITRLLVDHLDLISYDFYAVRTPAAQTQARPPHIFRPNPILPRLVPEGMPANLTDLAITELPVDDAFIAECSLPEDRADPSTLRRIGLSVHGKSVALPPIMSAIEMLLYESPNTSANQPRMMLVQRTRGADPEALRMIQMLIAQSAARVPAARRVPGGLPTLGRRR